MDVSSLLDAQNAKYKAVTVEKDIPFEIDPGYLTVTDLNPLDPEEYKTDPEAYLQATTRDGIQMLVSSLFSLPVQSSEDGPLAMLPPPTTLLPRAKPLPKPKQPTKWEKFAAAKGISKTKRDKKVWDEEKQEWVNRWGKGGKNKEVEEQWAVEVKANAPLDFDPVKDARDARKARIAKNENQRTQNAIRAQRQDAINGGGPVDRSSRKNEIEKTLLTTRQSTASMGKFDKKLEGEPKSRGVKRKFEPTEISLEVEKKASLALLSKLDGPQKKSRSEPKDDVLNVRKALRFASRGSGGVALGRQLSSRGSKGGARGRGRGGKR